MQEACEERLAGSLKRTTLSASLVFKATDRRCKMPSPPIEESAPEPAGIVERLVRDDVDRKRFLKMAGSAGAVSFGAFVLAACGSSKKAASTATAPAGGSSTSTSSGVAAR